MKKNYIKPMPEKFCFGTPSILELSNGVSNNTTGQENITGGEAKSWTLEDELRIAIEEEMAWEDEQ